MGRTKGRRRRGRGRTVWQCLRCGCGKTVILQIYQTPFHLHINVLILFWLTTSTAILSSSSISVSCLCMAREHKRRPFIHVGNQWGYTSLQKYPCGFGSSKRACVRKGRHAFIVDQVQFHIAFKLKLDDFCASNLGCPHDRRFSRHVGIIWDCGMKEE